MSASRSTRLSIGFSLLLVAVIVLLSLYFIDFEEVGLHLRQADLRLLALAGMMLLGGFAVYSLRWQLLLQRRTSLGNAFHASNLGTLVNMLLPMNPGDAVRIYLLSRSSGIGVGHTASSVVVERVFENLLRLIAFSGMLVIGIGISNQSWSILAGLVGFLVVALLSLVWIKRNRNRILHAWPRYLGRIPRLSQESVYQTLVELLDAMQVMSSSHQLTSALFTSVFAWLFFFGFHYFTLQALNFPLTQQQMLALSLGILMIAPPSAPALPGVFHAQVVLPFAALGISGDYLTAYAIVLHAVEAGMIFLLGVLGLLLSGVSISDLLNPGDLPPVPAVVQPSAGD